MAFLPEPIVLLMAFFVVGDLGDFRCCALVVTFDAPRLTSFFGDFVSDSLSKELALQQKKS